MNDGLSFYVVEGRTPIVSGTIREQTRSTLTHSGILFDATDARPGCVFEAEMGGFEKFPGLDNNNSGCSVHLYTYDAGLTIAEVEDAYRFCGTLRGADYDTPMLLGFLQRLNYEPPGSAWKLFCSEAVFMVSLHLGPSRCLFRQTRPWEVPPHWIPRSPLIHWTETIQV